MIKDWREFVVNLVSPFSHTAFGMGFRVKTEPSVHLLSKERTRKLHQPPAANSYCVGAKNARAESHDRDTPVEFKFPSSSIESSELPELKSSDDHRVEKNGTRMTI